MRNTPPREALRLAAVVLAAGMACWDCPLHAQCVRDSPGHSVALVELYTSEGCDSCPPADRWLSGIGPTHAPNSVIPLSLHVDYWDGLGWKDRLADARYGERQRELTRLAGGRVVYTPGIFINLREFRGWRSGAEFGRRVAAVNAQPSRAAIRIALEPTAAPALALQARFELKGGGIAARRPQAFVALYESGLQTAVNAGENRGATLRHDYVVRRLIGPLEFTGGTAGFAGAVGMEPGWRRANMGVAAFVQDASGVLQATSLKVCG